MGELQDDHEEIRDPGPEDRTGGDWTEDRVESEEDASGVGGPDEDGRQGGQERSQDEEGQEHRPGRLRDDDGQGSRPRAGDQETSDEEDEGAEGDEGGEEGEGEEEEREGGGGEVEGCGGGFWGRGGRLRK